METGAEIAMEGLCDVENTIFVAVGKNVKESKSTLLWTLQNFAGRKICLLHIHQPAHLVTITDGKLSGSKLKQQVVKAYRNLEQQKMYKLLNQCLLILDQAGMQAGKVWSEMDNVEKGIVKIIAQHGIRWLVMGASAEKHYSKKMRELKSNKAIFVCQEAPVSCHICFVCKGFLIYTRSVDINSHGGSIVTLSSPTSTIETTLLQNHEVDVDEDASTFQCLEYSTSSTDKLINTLKISPSMADEMIGDGLPLHSPHKSQNRLLHSSSTSSTDKLIDTLKLSPPMMDEMIGDGLPLHSPRKSQDRLLRSSSVVLLAFFQEETSHGQATCDMYGKIEHTSIDADNSKQKAFEESVRQWKAEEDVVEALRKAEASESSYIKEKYQRKEMVEMLARQRQELERMKNQHDQFIKELETVRDEKPVLENQIMESRLVEEELEEKIIQAVKLLITFKEKRDELRTEHENAIREINKPRKLLEEGSTSLQFFALSFLEIIEATQNFDPSWKIGEGKCGSVYKGLLRHLKVAIKMLPCRGSQGDFEHEVEVLSRVRHPNLVTLIGTCPESRSLIYEYLENGSLEDCLACRSKTPPLPWQTRVKIAIEICSALIFLHSNKPCIVHGNLKLTNVLLGANSVSKLSEFGIYRLIPRDENPNNPSTLCNKTAPEVSIYMDPEFLETGELTTESDVYSFGIVLLQMITGRPALGTVKDVKCALEKGNFNTVLDFSAGDWPLEQAKQLAQLALRCCEKNRLNRPGLVSDIWAVIEPMRDSCSSPRPDSEGHRRIPSHFVCPIFQEVMKDPYIAADGFTYEADAIKGWLNSGHKTSPMTNLKLEHCDLLPNYALYYAIQGWLHQS